MKTTIEGKDNIRRDIEERIHEECNVQKHDCSKQNQENVPVAAK